MNGEVRCLMPLSISRLHSRHCHLATGLVRRRRDQWFASRTLRRCT